MASPGKQELLRRLPAVDELLRRERVRDWLSQYPRDLVVEEIRAALGKLRERIAEAGPAAEADGDFAAQVEQSLEHGFAALERPSLRGVINASGVILHTNLGRAPLSRNALDAVVEAAGGYSNLEFDLLQGRRGKRDVHAGALLEKVLGAPAIVVNNNAAAIFLVLNELAAGGEAIVSRGELIEIGDGFRIPDIVAKSGAAAREVGTTNRTRAADYRAAVGERTRLLLRVHPSNFRIVGFTERPSLEELVKLGEEFNLPVVEDLGSGCLGDFGAAGLEGESPAWESLRAGADLITFSGDKLLGGPQAGIIAGKSRWVQRVRRNPLFRVLRADKLTYAALEATLRDYILGRLDEIPVPRMIRETVERLRTRAEALAARLSGASAALIDVAESESVLGGGSTPGQTLPSAAVRIRPAAGDSAAKLERRLRRGQAPVVARCENGRLIVDMRTVAPEQEDALAAALISALAAAAEPDRAP